MCTYMCLFSNIVKLVVVIYCDLGCETYANECVTSWMSSGGRSAAGRCVARGRQPSPSSLSGFNDIITSGDEDGLLRAR